jgi:hypothetical protein
MDEAKKVIQEKLAQDAALKVTAIYGLYEGMDLIEEFDQSSLEETTTSGGNNSSGGQQKGSGQRFSPTPFNVTPMPGGLPRSYIKDENDKKDEDKK